MMIRRYMITVLSLFLFFSCNDERQRPVLDFEVHNPAESGSRFPDLHTEDGESLTMSWLSGIGEDIHALEFASFTGERWESPQSVYVGNDVFINWADFPSVVTLNSEPVALHWLKKTEGGPYAYDIQIAFPGEEPRRWNHITPHSDGTATEHGFVSMVPLGPDVVLAIWLDGRHTVRRGHDEYADMDQAMMLRSAIVHADGSIENERVIDAAVCDCCQTDLIAVNGGAAAVYRNRDPEEIRDISFARFDTETGEWSEPVNVHEDGWEISGCPVNGPRVAANGNRIAVAWYTEEGDDKRIQSAYSDDGGDSFSAPLRLNEGLAMGRVDIDTAPDGSFYVSWMEQGESLARILLRKIEDGQLMSGPVRIGSTDLERNSGFPRIAAMNEGIMVAWTQTDPFYRIRTGFYDYNTVDESIVEE